MLKVRSALTSAAIVFTLLFTLPALAQETAKELAARASGELRLLTSFQTLERTLGAMDRFLTYGIVSSVGGWGVLEYVDTTDYTNAGVVRNAAADLKVDAARANSAIQRSKLATDEDKSNATLIMSNLESLFEAAPELADTLAASDFDAARQLYKDRCQTPYQEAIRLSQSSVIGTEKRVGKTVLAIRTLK